MVINTHVMSLVQSQYVFGTKYCIICNIIHSAIRLFIILREKKTTVYPWWDFRVLTIAKWLIPCFLFHRGYLRIQANGWSGMSRANVTKMTLHGSIIEVSNYKVIYSSASWLPPYEAYLCDFIVFFSPGWPHLVASVIATYGILQMTA